MYKSLARENVSVSLIHVYVRVKRRDKRDESIIYDKNGSLYKYSNSRCVIDTMIRDSASSPFFYV